MKKNENKETNVNMDAVNDEEMFNEAEAMATVQGLAKISKNIKEEIVNVTRQDARYLVDAYYQVQKMRVRTNNQLKAISKSADSENYATPTSVKWVYLSTKNTEEQIKLMLDAYTDSHKIGQWLKSVIGIGPVLAAGLMSNFDINGVNHFGQFHSYAGLNDNNNPWLGKEGANKMVRDIRKSLKEKDKETVLYCKDNIRDWWKFEAYIEECLTSASKHDYFVDYLSTNIKDVVNSKWHPQINSIIEHFDDESLVAGFLVRTYLDDKLLTPEFYTQVMIKTTRNITSIKKGINNVIENRKDAPKYINPTTADMSAYLAKPPYNLDLKKMCYLIGDQFMKRHNNPKSVYGKLYEERKALIIKQNLEGKYAEQSAEYLAKKNISKSTKTYQAYSKGLLPDGQIDMRARRYAVKIFISHVFEAMYIDKHGKLPPLVYPIEYLGHADYIKPEVPYSDYWYYDEE